jgi:hypothetical protein
VVEEAGAREVEVVRSAEQVAGFSGENSVSEMGEPQTWSLACRRV